MRLLVLIGILGGLLAATAAVVAYAWTSMAEVDISPHGILALVLGVVLSLLLGAGLMFLIFYSSRRGYDDDVGS
ncbi:MAG: hypothetical protein QNJ67_10950 [Kiloniellales bacterium]|nr:hypothetical protein [Kiloniellales bacterium]